MDKPEPSAREEDTYRAIMRAWNDLADARAKARAKAFKTAMFLVLVAIAAFMFLLVVVNHASK